jgi:hypothetical protein
MKGFLIATGLVGAFAAGSLALAGTAAAEDTLTSDPANVAITQLRSDGYDVQLNLNGPRDVPFSECSVDGVHGIPNNAPVDGGPTAQFTTVYLDVNCPPDLGD